MGRQADKIFRFVRHHTKQIYNEGVPAIFRKTRALLIMPIALAVALIVRILKPLVIVRFGFLLGGRIGHFAANTELYLCKRDLGMDTPKTFDVFYHSSWVCNKQLKRMWDRTLRVCWFAKEADRFNRLLPGYRVHEVPLSEDRDIYDVFRRTRPHLFFTPDEEKLGQAALHKLGISEGTAFVCFHARDVAYLSNVYTNKNWNYHKYRDMNINNYIPAAEELAQRGHFSIRMGKIVKEAFSVSNPRIIDYAKNNRDDFLDIYLSANCRFFISSGSGIDSVAVIFRRPLVYVNFIPLESVLGWAANSLFIPKKLWSRNLDRFLTFREVLDSGIGRFFHNEKYEQMGIEVIENTPEEIAAVAIEMDERLKGTWQMSSEDESLQRRFWNLFKPSKLNKVFLTHIGTEFLRQNQELLE